MPDVRGVDDVESIDIDQLDEDDPFEFDTQIAHLSKHPPFSVDDLYDVWNSNPRFYQCDPPASLLMVAGVAGRVIVVPITFANSGDRAKCRPIGIFEAGRDLSERYRSDERNTR